MKHDILKCLKKPDHLPMLLIVPACLFVLSNTP